MSESTYAVIIFTGEDHRAGCTLNRCPMEGFEVPDRKAAQVVMEKYAAYDPHFITIHKES